MIRIILSLTLFLSFAFLFAQENKSVLFLGNSYTQSNNLPNLINQMAMSTGDVLIYDAVMPGGFRLMDHVNSAASLEKIYERDWDYVVLQEQSQMPAFPLAQVQNQVFPYAQQLSDLIRTNHACSVPMFFTTWGRKNGDQQNCPHFPPLCTYEGMDDLLQERYRMMAEDNKGVLSPVAAVWREIRIAYPELELYTADGSHPSMAGSMAAAYTFYTVIFQKNPEFITFHGNLSDLHANGIKEIVRETVFDNFDHWLVSVHDNFANFNVDQDGFTAHFTSTQTIAHEWHWDLGDGNISTDENPIHTYSEEGVYTVVLTALACEKTYTFSKQIHVSMMGVTDLESDQIKLYPNPAQDYIFVNSTSVKNIAVISMLGHKKPVNGQIQNNKVKIDLKHLPSGTYFLHCEVDSYEYALKFIKQ